MTRQERIEKMTENFTLLPEEKQNYILGILQALVFAHHNSANSQPEVDHSGSEQNTEPEKNHS